MKDLLEVVNLFISLFVYIVFGYVFLFIYDFVSSQSHRLENRINLIPPIIIGFLLKNIFDFIVVLFHNTSLEGTPLYYIVCAFFSALLAVFLGYTLHHYRWNEWLINLGIRRTTNRNIWNDILIDDAWVFIQLKNQPVDVQGAYIRVSENEKKPLMVLSRYQLFERDTGKILKDYSRDDKSVLIIDTDDVAVIQLKYINHRVFDKSRLVDEKEDIDCNTQQ